MNFVVVLYTENGTETWALLRLVSVAQRNRTLTMWFLLSNLSTSRAHSSMVLDGDWRGDWTASQDLSWDPIQPSSDRMTRDNDSIRVTTLGDSLDSSQRILPNDSTRVTINDSRLESKSYSQNHQASDWQAHFVFTKRNEFLLLQWWSILAQIFFFYCVS